jgi:periplasmic divalent cation tolerance protein
MADRRYCQLLLTCEDAAEAGRIADTLLQQHLIVCAKQIPVTSKYWWESELESAKEVQLVMESAEDLFDAVEREVTKLHSYESFVLQSVPFGRVSGKARAWMDQNLVKGSRAK